MEGKASRVHQCTTAYFAGLIALVSPDESWVAKWQRIDQFKPGMYAVDMVGCLPDEDIEYLEDHEIPYKCTKAPK